MASRIKDLPCLSSMSSMIDATHFNAIRLGLLRLGSPLHLSMPGMRTLEMILENDAWICVDNSLNDLPVVAWTDFVIGKREALNEPVQCKISFYHAHAGMILQKLLDLTQQEIETRLHSQHASNH